MTMGYQQVGQAVPAGEVLVGIDAFEQAREAALGDLLDIARTPRVKVYDQREMLQYALYLPSLDPENDNTSDGYLSVSLSDDQIIPSTRLRVSFSRPLDQRPNDNERSIYELETYNQQLVEAKVVTYLVRSLTALPFEDTGYLDSDDLHREVSERLITGEDCRALIVLMRRSANRVKALRG